MIARLQSVVLDAADIAAEAGFYRGLTDWPQQDAEDDWITLAPGTGWTVSFQLAPDHVPPQWPGQARPQQAHLDLRVGDLDAGIARAIGLGATDTGRGGESWRTVLDPAGHPLDICYKADNPGTTLFGVTLDCPDAKALSRFYAEVLGWPVTWEGDGIAMIGNDGEQPMLFQQVEEYTAPQWPDPAHPQQVHLDLEVPDADAAQTAETQVLALGATRLGGGGQTFRVYADPAGKPFCLCWRE
jgi:catechol 2,3-dioxygenase-like lactoylglutathione lyase family enzyme